MDARATLLLVASIATSLSIDAQSGAITGTIIDHETRRGLAYATITLNGNGPNCITDSMGVFRIDALAPGSYAIRVAHIGWGDTTVTGIAVADGAITELIVRIPECPYEVLGKARKCPVCGSVDTVINIHYGKATKRDRRNAARGRIHLVEGGRPRCAPSFRCKQDGTEF